MSNWQREYLMHANNKNSEHNTDTEPSGKSALNEEKSEFSNILVFFSGQLYHSDMTACTRI